jgi:glycerophosphoryl diester phosphodiesterase
MLTAIAAHRAWHVDGAPKNSMAALEAAAHGGVDSVEIDVRRLGDGTLVVHHDPTMRGRLLATMTVDDLPLDGTVPTLEQWAGRAGELDVRVLAELKEGGYEREVVDTLTRHVPADRIDYFSFREGAVGTLTGLVPDRPVGLLHDPKRISGTMGAIHAHDLAARARQLGASFVGINHLTANDAVLDALHGAGMGIAVWPDSSTPETLADVHRLVRDPRVTTFITDRPAFALGERVRHAKSLGSDVAQLGVKLLRAAATMR